MGVTALKKLVESLNISEQRAVTHTGVVIDGPSLYYSLYFKSNPRLDQRHGGDYSGFRDQVHRFFDVLRDQEVTPYVFLDGGSDSAKQATLESRMKNKLENAVKKAEEEASAGGADVLPPLIKVVFIETLRQRGVQFEQCLGEADLNMVLYANKRRVPVLSDDSDFYIYDVAEGFLPLDSFQWTESTAGGIPARRYTVTEFCSHFKLDCALMPVFASIAGNDYSRLENRDVFVREHPPPEPSRDKRIYVLRAMLRFLASLNRPLLNESERRERAVREALRLAGEKDVERFRHSMNKYIGAEGSPRPELPPWLCERLRQGKLASFIINVVTQRTAMLTPLVEDFSHSSCYDAARRIRQYLYGLLIGSEQCTEYERSGRDSVRMTSIRPLLLSEDRGEQQRLKLPHLDEVPEDLRQKVLNAALNDPGSTFSNIPDHMKLPVCVTSCWFRHRTAQHQGSPNVHYLHALLLGFVYDPCNAVMSALKEEGLTSRLLPDAAHAFSQWQCCLSQSLCLNQLLGFPLPEPECARLYCGPLVHRLAQKLKTGSNAATELQDTLREEQRRLFEDLKTAVDGTTSSSSEEAWSVQKRRHKTTAQTDSKKKKTR